MAAKRRDWRPKVKGLLKAVVLDDLSGARDDIDIVLHAVFQGFFIIPGLLREEVEGEEDYCGK